MAKVISTHSFRGGTGKSNTTANLAVLIAKAGHRVGVIDTDIQSPGIHVLFQLPESRVKHALNDYLWGKCAIQDAAYDVTAAAIGNAGPELDRPRIFLIPSSVNSGEISRVLREGYDVGRLNDGFRQVVRDLDLDYLLIDTHPGVNEETLLSIAISDLLLLVMRPDSQDFQGTAVTAELARRLEIPEMLILVNKVPPGMDPAQLRLRVEQLYQAEVAALLPMNFEIVRVASGSIFVNRFPEHPMTLGLRQVAERVLRSG
ncbi:MAG TPA: MinD/ParA family protein [Lacipirellulaceae bacterium]|nr:MinD/ParA family protein [Lacipirellulaceae bacterium]